MTATPCLIGRSSSHFTRVVRVIAAELGVPYAFRPVFDLASCDPADYGGNPAMKLPVLHLGAEAVFGAENICRTLAERHSGTGRILWTEQLPGPAARNVQEMVWHAMAAQVQMVFGTQAAHLPADNLYFAKAARGLAQVLAWLDARLDDVLVALPPRTTSLMEVSLFCLLEHLDFRPSVGWEDHRRLQAFAAGFAQRPSARATAYRLDRPDGPESGLQAPGA
ncbi:MAG: glutathione S-transferase family protein [Xanthomonadaceae bacterium]|nr:glutathione S-transferase family protein [Xanthomonadaceae bacterium]MDE1965339.1 glutathione S-transferase [Xanthomonadaceae bacterium]